MTHCIVESTSQQPLTLTFYFQQLFPSTEHGHYICPIASGDAHKNTRDVVNKNKGAASRIYTHIDDRTYIYFLRDTHARRRIKHKVAHGSARLVCSLFRCLQIHFKDIESRASQRESRKINSKQKIRLLALPENEKAAARWTSRRKNICARGGLRAVAPARLY